MDFLLSSSPSIILLLTAFLLISHFPIYGRAEREFHIIADFKSDCAFHLGDYSFNLCPLAGSATAATKYSRDLIDNGDIDLVEEPSSGTRRYEVAQGSSLPSSVSSISFWEQISKAHFKHFSAIVVWQVCDECFYQSEILSYRERLFIQMVCPLRSMTAMGIAFLPRINCGRIWRRKVYPSREELMASTARSLLSKMKKLSVSGIVNSTRGWELIV